ncbi:helix-turn-helix transcriptional regulator [Allomesorhizobium camelthorni]|uniref:Helix-turn-helix domain-containing protein n=1 Tax=Allomesorhizobium camelthorni TaxID=475069 RepID=A0A6G4WEH6_9HYPH|nr:helix-turn-helix domain-containing protein [Mesorhizobium camelthorni]NGO53009.1 helix-turn-helix domain-containing protein [Mesorhizobium camelthorni]
MDDENERAARAKKGSPFLNTAQAAFYIGLSQRTLEKMRLTGGGPKYRKHGRYVRYHIDELDDWSKGSSQDSTSEHDESGSSSAGDGGRS